MNKLYQINFQCHFGGGEVYTLFLCQALQQLDIATTLLCHPEAKFWQSLTAQGSTLIPMKPTDMSVVQSLGMGYHTVLTHGSIPLTWRKAIRQAGHFLVGIAHMPLYGRDQHAFDEYDLVIGVSDYVIQSLRDAGVGTVYPKAWYGVAASHAVGHENKGLQTWTKTSVFDWDKRKGRDRLLSWLEPYYLPLLPKPIFQKKAGLTLGIVSRLTPIKQFPLLFSYLTPILQQYPEVNVEIIGSGGYASVRDLKQQVQALGQQVRFWGQQRDVASVYRQLDFLLTGLPEKEALGLNVLEAQAVGLPVLAVNAPPFTETVLDAKTGFLFTDPRIDQGQHFTTLLQELLAGKRQKPRPQDYPDHLANFSFAAFSQRVALTLPFLFP